MYHPSRRRVVARHSPEQMTKQSHKNECDINTILRQYRRTGIINHVRAGMDRGAFVDLPEVNDYQDALHTVMAAERAFQQLPAKVRAEFGNDPGAFVAAFDDPAKEARLRELGLLNPARPPDPEAGEPPAKP